MHVCVSFEMNIPCILMCFDASVADAHLHFVLDSSERWKGHILRPISRSPRLRTTVDLSWLFEPCIMNNVCDTRFVLLARARRVLDEQLRRRYNESGEDFVMDVTHCPSKYEDKQKVVEVSIGPRELWQITAQECQQQS